MTLNMKNKINELNYDAFLPPRPLIISSLISSTFEIGGLSPARPGKGDYGILCARRTLWLWCVTAQACSHTRQ